MLRRITLLAALAAVSGFFLIGAGAASAKSAHRAVIGASCGAPQTGAIWYNGYWPWNALLVNCQAVNAAEFATPSGSQGYTVYIGCHANCYTGAAGVHYSFAGGGVINGVYAQYQTTYVNIVFGSGCGVAPFQVFKGWSYRIKNANNNTWGPWHYTESTYEWLC